MYLIKLGRHNPTVQRIDLTLLQHYNRLRYKSGYRWRYQRSVHNFAVHCKGQRSRSNMLACRVKLHYNVTSNLQGIGNFVIENVAYENSSQGQKSRSLFTRM